MRPLWMALAVLLLLPAAQAEEIPDSGDIGPGETYSYTFTEVFEDGHYYHCHPHPWMWAMVHVFEEGTLSTQDPGTNTHHVEIVEGADSDDWGYSSQHLSIEVGDTVVWTNNGTLVHTVSPGDPSGGDGHDHDHGDHADDGHHDDESTDVPAPSLLGLGLALLAAVVLGRRA